MASTRRSGIASDIRHATAAACLAVALAGCSNIGNLVPGQASVEDVRRELGQPAMVAAEPDGSTVLAYPTAPMGYRTMMARIGPGGRLLGIENVLDSAHFAEIKPGMTKEQVLRTLGPPVPGRTMYFKARDELAWDWHYCDDWNIAAYFSVLFDATRETVRSTLSVREICGRGECFCAH